MRFSKQIFYLTLSLVMATMTFMAVGHMQGDSVNFRSASTEGDVSAEETTTSTTEEITTTSEEEGTTTTAEEQVTYIDPNTGEEVTAPASQVPQNVVVITTTTTTEGERSEPEAEVTTTTEAPPPPPTTTTTFPSYTHRVQVVVEGDRASRASINLICASGQQWSWSASGEQILDTQDWTTHQAVENCFVNWFPADARQDVSVTPDNVTVVTIAI